jgi:hypothetical protein
VSIFARLDVAMIPPASSPKKASPRFKSVLLDNGLCAVFIVFPFLDMEMADYA